MKTHYVYAHSNSEFGVFYVGKGSAERLFKTGNRTKLWRQFTHEHGFTASILETCDSEDAAFEREIHWIKFYKESGQCQANVSLGGKGVTVEKRWWGDKIAIAMKGKVMPRGENNAAYKSFVTEARLRELYVDQQLPSTEVAKALGVSVTTVCSRLAQMGIGVRPTPKKAIFCPETNKRYPSIAEAARETGLFRENIRKVLAGKYKTTGGLTFNYGDENE